MKNLFPLLVVLIAAQAPTAAPAQSLGCADQSGRFRPVECESTPDSLRAHDVVPGAMIIRARYQQAAISADRQNPRRQLTVLTARRGIPFAF